MCPLRLPAVGINPHFELLKQEKINLIMLFRTSTFWNRLGLMTLGWVILMNTCFFKREREDDQKRNKYGYSPYGLSHDRLCCVEIPVVRRVTTDVVSQPCISKVNLFY